MCTLQLQCQANMKWGSCPDPCLWESVGLCSKKGDIISVQSRNYGKLVKCLTRHFKLGLFKNGLGQIIMIIPLSSSYCSHG